MKKHPTIADELGGQWHKVVGALVLRYGMQELTEPDFAPLDGQAVVVTHKDEGRTIVVRVMPQAEADRLAAEFQQRASRGR